MPIPDFHSFFLPVLRISDGGAIKPSEAVDIIADEFEITERERDELVPGGTITRVKDRVKWAVTYLVHAGLVERPRRGYFAITPLGKTVLLDPPERIDRKFLLQFEGFRDFQSRTGTRRPSRVKPT